MRLADQVYIELEKKTRIAHKNTFIHIQFHNKNIREVHYNTDRVKRLQQFFFSLIWSLFFSVDYWQPHKLQTIEDTR